MVIFSGKRFNHELCKGEVPGTLYGMSDSGWMDQELFSNWFSNHFLKHAVSSRPILLLLDGHSSHYTLELVKRAAEEEVIIFCLPPHTTADSQPLDTSCFGPLKTYWGKACRQYMFANPGQAISKFRFSTLFSEAWSNGMSINNIVSGFRCTGIYPFNPNAILGKMPQQEAETSEQEMIDSEEARISDEVEEIEGDTAPSLDSSLEDVQPVTTSTFTQDELQLFERRFDNLFTDKKYVAWLEKYHPGSVDISSVMDAFTSVVPLEESSSLFDAHLGEYMDT